MTPAKSLTVHHANLPPSELDALLAQYRERLVWMVCACYFNGTPDCLYGPFDRAGQIATQDRLRGEEPARPVKLFLLIGLDELDPG